MLTHRRKALVGLWILGALGGGAAACASSGTSGAGAESDAGARTDAPAGDAHTGDASPGDAAGQDGAARDGSHDGSRGDASAADAAKEAGSDGDGGDDSADASQDAAACVAASVMVCGWGGGAGALCALSNGASSFGASSAWQPGFDGASQGEVATIQYPDVNGDGLADFCAWDASGVQCALSNGTSFGQLGTWQASFDGSWNDAASDYLSIRFPDVNGDGKADVCGRNSAGIQCALSTGSTFGALGTWSGDFTDAAGWNGPAYEFSIQFADVNGDGKADVCGRGVFGIDCALSNGGAFGPLGVWQGDYSDAAGWAGDPSYWETIRFADVNGDGMADVCGRGQFGVDCAVSNGAAFGPMSIWLNDMTDAGGWSAPAYYPSIQFPDVDGDGKADVCGRGAFGVDCAVSNGAGFGALGVWQGDYSDAAGWGSSPAYYTSVQFPDVNADGKADVCGRSGLGIACAVSNGASFGAATTWQADFSDANGWNTAAPYQSIQFPIAIRGNCSPAAEPAPLFSPYRRLSY